MIPSLPPSRPSLAPSASSSSSSSDDNIIDLGQFNHPAPVPATAPPAAVPEPTETHGFADEFMKRIFTVVPPPSAGAELASRGATPSLPAAARLTSNTAPTSRSSSPPPTANKDASNVAQRSVGGALEGLRSSLDLGALPSWLGGSAPKAGSNALAKGKGRAQEGLIQDETTTRSSFDDSVDPPIRAVPTAAHPTTPSSSSPRPPPLISSFPTFDTSPSGPSSLSDRLLEAIEEPVTPSPSSSGTTTPRHQPARSQSSPDVPASLPTLFAATSTSSSGSTAHFIPPTLPTAPPLAHFDASFPSLHQTSRARHVRTPSFKQQNATALATSSFFSPSLRSTSPTGFGGPYLHRSATLNSIDELRGVQNRQGGVQKRPISSGSGWWREHKTMVDGMLKDEDKADTVEGEEEVIAQRHESPKNPVVFCHGLFGFDHLGPASLPALQISHWRGIKEVLEGNDTEVFIARVPATSSIEERATILMGHIEERFPGRSVNLIGHSMGGLDCRYLISKLKPKSFKVASLTTVATPHRGSAFADHLIDDIIGQTNMPSVLSMLDVIRLPNQGDGQAFDALSTRAMKVFNFHVVNDPDVKYYSWGAKFEPSYFNTFKWSHTVILAKEGPNDGLVSVQSAHWGEYQGTLENVNHLDLVGWVNPVRYTISEWVGKPISFKPASFYLDVADHLAKQGF